MHHAGYHMLPIELVKFKNALMQVIGNTCVHVNPADFASRGILPNELIKNDLWFCGPNQNGPALM